MERNKGFTLIELIAVVATVGVVAGTVVLVSAGAKALKKYNESTSIKVERANVIGDSKAEQFIEYKGKRFYSEIDGRPVEQYLPTYTNAESSK